MTSLSCRSKSLCLPLRLAAIVFAFIIFLLANSSFAQTAKPELAVDSAMARLAAKNWTGFVWLVHPSSLQEFKFYVMKVTQVRIQSGANDPDFDALFGRPTLEELTNAPADILLANFLRSATQAAPDFERVLTQTKMQRLGVVDEGTEFKHVVLRSTYQFGDTFVKRIEVITLQKDGTAWKLLLPPAIETFLNQLGWPKIDR